MIVARVGVRLEGADGEAWAGWAGELGEPQSRLSEPMSLVDRACCWDRSGRCPARHYMDIVLPKLAAGRLDPQRVITHVLPLPEGTRAYTMFDRKEDDCLKILLAAD